MIALGLTMIPTTIAIITTTRALTTTTVMANRTTRRKDGVGEAEATMTLEHGEVEAITTVADGEVEDTTLEDVAVDTIEGYQKKIVNTILRYVDCYPV